MKIIYKYRPDAEGKIYLPEGSRFIKAEVEPGGCLALSYEIDTAKPLCSKTVFTCSVNKPITDARKVISYLGKVECESFVYACEVLAQ